MNANNRFFVCTFTEIFIIREIERIKTMIKNIIGWVFIPYIKLARIVYRKWEGKYSNGLRLAGSISLGVIGFIVWAAILGNLPGRSSQADTTAQQTPARQESREPELSPEEKAKQDYHNWIQSQFSAWDGSHIHLVSLVKENMNDPKSFEHVETRYTDNGDNLTVFMKFRGTNAFGGKILNSVNATADYKTNTIKITEYN